MLADTTNRIAEGEVLQLLHVRNPDTDETAYLRVIERKTAVLFAAATRLGALLAGADAATCDALHDYGMNLGYAFQIADDVLDYASDAETLGKNLGDDLAEGKATLPLIHAMLHSDAATRDRLRHAVEHGDTDALPDVLRPSAPPAVSTTAASAHRSTRKPPNVRSAVWPTTTTPPRCAAWHVTPSIAITDPAPAGQAHDAGPGDAEAGDRADAVGVEAGQLGEMPAARDVVAIRTETRRARRQQHDALARQAACGLRAWRPPGRPPRTSAKPACAAIGCEQVVDARPVLAHGDDRQRRRLRMAVGELLPRQAAVVAADQHGDAAIAEAVERRQAGMRRGADRIVDVGDAVARAERLQAMRQRLEARGMRRQRDGIQAQRFDRRQHRAQVAAVVPARQRQRARVHHERVAAIQRVLAQMPAVFVAEPAARRCRGSRSADRIGSLALSTAMRGLRFGHQAQLVGDIALVASRASRGARETRSARPRLRGRAPLAATSPVW